MHLKLPTKSMKISFEWRVTRSRRRFVSMWRLSRPRSLSRKIPMVCPIPSSQCTSRPIQPIATTPRSNRPRWIPCGRSIFRCQSTRMRMMPTSSWRCGTLTRPKRSRRR
uniref:(northern house mosquito) hypothetical protein n=1 Tax=Culex pipiens TaxID=7175 RepID=A0A8D8CIH3_CULPI